MGKAANLAAIGSIADTPLQFRNRIINGAMMIDQRYSGSSVTIPGGNTYVVDRFFGGASQGSKYSMQQNAGAVTGPTGFRNYLGVTSLSAYSPLSTDDFSIQHNIEGYNLADLNWGSSNAQPATLSFWVRSSLTGTFGVALRNYGTWNFSYVASYTVNAANTWEYKTIAIPAPTTGTFNGANNSGAVNIAWDLGCGTGPSGSATGAWQSGNFQGLTGGVKLISTNGATFYITGVQLERGANQNPIFEHRPYGVELALCQRYFEQVNAVFSGYTGGGNNAANFANFIVQKRAVPTQTWKGGVQQINFSQASAPGIYATATVRQFYPFRASSGTGQDSRWEDSYWIDAEL